MRPIKLFRSATNPANWRALTRGVIPTIEHRRPLGGLSPSTVIDVGANKGQFSVFAHGQWPKARIHAFEPIPDQGDRYMRVMDQGATLHRCALGATAGQMTLHLASRADSSSLLPLGETQKELFHMSEIGLIEVPVLRLDEALPASEVVAPALLKIDVQGFEYEVLRGIANLRPQIRWIYVETSFVELYKGQKLYPEVAGLLASMGYDEKSRSNLAHDENGRAVQADILFAASPGGKWGNGDG